MDGYFFGEKHLIGTSENKLIDNKSESFANKLNSAQDLGKYQILLIIKKIMLFFVYFKLN